MTRDEKITAFFREHDDCLRWCDPLDGPCACMGCINCGRAHAWRQAHPDEPPITEEEFDRISPPLQPPPQSPISFSFRSLRNPKGISPDLESLRASYERDLIRRQREHQQRKDEDLRAFLAASAIAKRSDQITLLEAYSKFLEDRGYLDTDWRTEAPYAIDEFLKTQKP